MPQSMKAASQQVAGLVFTRVLGITSGCIGALVVIFIMAAESYRHSSFAVGIAAILAAGLVTGGMAFHQRRPWVAIFLYCLTGAALLVRLYFR